MEGLFLPVLFPYLLFFRYKTGDTREKSLVNVYPGLSHPILSYKRLTMFYVLEVPIATTST